MRWPGVRDDTSAIGGGLQSVQNVSFRKKDSIIRRPGLSDRIDYGGTALSELNDQIDGLYYIISNSEDGDIKSVKASDGTVTALNTTLQDRRGDFAASSGKVYFANGFDPMQVIESGVNPTADAGIVAPDFSLSTGVASGSATDGDHLVRVRYKDTSTGYYSNPSEVASVTTASQKIQVTIGAGDVSSNTRVDQIVLEATLAGGTVYYEADTIGNEAGTLELDIPDSELQLQALYGSGVGNAPAPLFDIIHEHRGRLFGIGLTPIARTNLDVVSGNNTFGHASGYITEEMEGLNIRFDGDTVNYTINTVGGTSSDLTSDYQGTTGTKNGTVFRRASDLLFWSSPTLPEGWDSVNNARRVFQGRADAPSCLFSYYDDLMIAGQRSLFRYIYDSDPAFARLELIPGDLGVYNRHCVVEAEGRLYGFGAGGIWVMDGLIPVIISDPIEDTLSNVVDGSQKEKFFATFDPLERAMTFHYVKSGDTEPYYAVSYDLDSGNMSIRSWRQALVGGLTTVDTNNSAVALLSDNNGYSWIPRAQVFDGVASGFTGSYTAAAGSTDTIIQVSDTLPTSPTLEGAICYIPSTGEERRITTNTSSSLTVSSAFSSAPPDGEPIWVGSIRMQFRTKWIGDQQIDRRKVNASVGIRFVPNAVGSDMNLYTYQDFASASVVVTSGASDVYPAGITATNGLSYIIADTSITSNADGWVSIPMTSKATSHVSFEMQQYEPGGDLEIVDFLPTVGGEVRNIQ